MSKGHCTTCDDLAEQLMRIRDKYAMIHGDYDCITQAAVEIHTAHESLHAVYLYGSYDGAAKERAARDAAEAHVARLVAALRRIDAKNDNSACFNPEINVIVMAALEE
jgi:hypothetical protein